MIAETDMERYEQDESPPQEILPGLMTEEQARAAAASIRKNVQRWEKTTETLRRQLVEFQELEGYRALGYRSMKECLLPEFGIAESTLYRQLAAAAVEENVGVPTGSLKESHARTLAALPPEAQREAYQEASVDGGVTQRSIRTAVERRILSPSGKELTRKQPTIPAAPAEDSGWEDWIVAVLDRSYLREQGLDLAGLMRLARAVVDRAPDQTRAGMVCRALLAEARSGK